MNIKICHSLETCSPALNATPSRLVVVATEAYISGSSSKKFLCNIMISPRFRSTQCLQVFYQVSLQTIFVESLISSPFGSVASRDDDDTP